MIDVSVIIPCRDEEPFIAQCLDSVIANGFATERLEVLVVDGMSGDRTREIVRGYAKRFPLIRLLENPRQIASTAQNIGIEHASGRILLMLDAHAGLEPGYIAACLECLDDHKDVDCVGGTMVTLPQESTPVGEAIAAALSSPFGVGASWFRIGTRRPVRVDSVYCGCYRREVFDRIGKYNDTLRRGQDYELHRRLRAADGKTLLVPTMTCRYYARSRLNAALLKYYFWEGFWAIYPFKVVGCGYLTWSHLVPFAFVTSLWLGILAGGVDRSLAWIPALLLVLYLAADLGASVAIAVRRRRAAFAVLLPLIFLAIHVSYGAGSTWAFLKGRQR